MNYILYSLNIHKEAINSLTYKTAAQDILLTQLFKSHRK